MFPVDLTRGVLMSFYENDIVLVLFLVGSGSILLYQFKKKNLHDGKKDFRHENIR